MPPATGEVEAAAQPAVAGWFGVEEPPMPVLPPPALAPPPMKEEDRRLGPVILPGDVDRLLEGSVLGREAQGRTANSGRAGANASEGRKYKM